MNKPETIFGLPVQFDSSIPIETIYMLPPDVQMAIETTSNAERAYKDAPAMTC